ncbi:MAG: hypothetical protein A2W64_03360 [Candidatus Zambryskibacteria bacterium RIFCSPLOWO2_02_39_10]|nr:MAG: hypothetical protein A2W64_03360 [Candidatus Zambryskibacteria bacterium RIFCSPLOWO2_02_39_10]
MTDGVRREVREELNSEINNLSLVKVVENIFMYEGNPGHEVVFIYTAEFVNKELYKKEKIHIVEPHLEFDAEWISIAEVLNGKIILYPATDYSDIFKN